MTDLLQGKQIVTVHNKRSKNPTVNLSALWNSCAKIECCSSELIFTFRYVGSRIQNKSEKFVSCILLRFANFPFLASPQTGLKELGLDIHTILCW